MTRVLFVVHQYPPEKLGGVELGTQLLARALASRGYRTAVFHRRSMSGRGVCKEVDSFGVQVFSIWDGEVTPKKRFFSNFGNSFIQKSFRESLREFKPALVHIRHLQSLPLALFEYIREQSIPVVVSLHDYWWVCANAQLLTNYNNMICNGPNYYLNCARCALARVGWSRAEIALPILAMLFAYRNHRLREVIKSVDLIIAPTKFVRDWHLDHGFPANKIVVLPHGVASVTLPNQTKAAIAEKDKVVFLYVGGITPQKGLHILIDAFVGVKGKSELWIAGDETDPSYATHLRQHADSRVLFLGRLDREQVWQTMMRADAVVVPSLWYEAYSNLISEAFAAGKPVLASQLGALAERVRNGVDGLLLPPGDVEAWRAAMQRVVDHPQLLAQLSSSIQKPWSIDAYVEQLELLYKLVLQLKQGQATSLPQES